MIKKLNLLVLSAMLLPSLSSIPVNAQTSQNYNGVKLINDVIVSKEFIEEKEYYLHEKYGENYQEIITRNRHSAESANRIEKFLKNKNARKMIYPNYIGGLYIDDDANLIIQIVKKNIPKINDKEYDDYQTIVSVDNDSIISYVEYSYEELNEIHDIILNNHLGKNNNITGLYIDNFSNRVVVELKSYNNETINQFKKTVMDSPMILFEKGGVFEEVATVNPGGGFVSSTNSGCSYGYRAKTSSGQIGVVTAGHCFKANGNTIPGVGTVTKYQNNGTLDAAFVATNSGVTLTNTLSQKPPLGTTTTISTTVSSFSVGQAVAKVGDKTGYSNGAVKATNYSYTSNGVTYTNLVRAQLACDNGDSGGIVFVDGLIYPQTSFSTLGIAKAKGTGSYAGQCLITKASSINSTFGLSRY